MNTKERRIAQEGISFLKDHGLTIDQGWQLNGKPPQDVEEYLNATIECCFPSDEDEVVKQAIELIEMDLEAGA